MVREIKHIRLIGWARSTIGQKGTVVKNSDKAGGVFCVCVFRSPCVRKRLVCYAGHIAIVIKQGPPI